MAPQRIVRRQWLLREDVEHRPGELAALQRRQHILIDHMLPRPGDQHRPAEPVEQRRGEDTSGLRGERQEVNQPVKRPEEAVERLLAAIAGDASQLLFTARPAGTR